VSNAPADLSPMDAIAAALATFGTDSMVPRQYLRQRQAVTATIVNDVLLELRAALTA
jgi:hypothetical protein